MTLNETDSWFNFDDIDVFDLYCILYGDKKLVDVNAIMEKIPDQIGYLILTEDGAVLESGGELENDERIATIITGLITLSNSVDPIAFGPNEQFKKISITYDDHWFIICISNKKTYVVKRNIQTITSEGNSVVV